MTSIVERDKEMHQRLKKQDELEALIECEANKIVQVRKGDKRWLVTINLNTIATTKDRQKAHDRCESERQLMRMRLREFYATCKQMDV